MSSARRRTIGALLLSCLLVGCAVPVQISPAQLMPASNRSADIAFAQDLPIRLSTGYTRTVPKGSRWRVVGLLPQGAVYRPLDTVFAIEGRQVHEAWLVVQAGALQGFYLPGENNFSPLSPPLDLQPSTGATR